MERKKEIYRSDAQIKSSPTTYAFLWDPKAWDIEQLRGLRQEIDLTGSATIDWRCVSHTKIKPGDRALLLTVGNVYPKGLIGSGKVIGFPFLGPDFRDPLKESYSVNIELDILQIPGQDQTLSRKEILKAIQQNSNWKIQASGTSVESEIAEKIERRWLEFLNEIVQESQDTQKPGLEIYLEGGQVRTNRLVKERDRGARNKCLEKHGYDCWVCEFNFRSFYGKIGEGYMHVHHREPMSSREGEYYIDPENDLVPVCPNCHAMLHRHSPPYSIEELKQMMKEAKEV